MQRGVVVVLLLVLASISSTLALYASRGPVQRLGARDFDASLDVSQKTHLVEFYAPWCGHCKSLAPTYEKTAHHLAGLVHVNAVDCDDEANRPLCGRYEVKGFPTIKIFPGPSRKGGKRGSPKDYNGPRTAAGLVDAARSAMPDFVARLTDDEAAQLDVAQDGPFKVVLFTDKSTTSPLYKGLASEFVQLDFYQVGNDQADLMSAFGVDRVPRIVLVKSDGKMAYDGKIDYPGLSKWLQESAAAPSEAERPFESRLNQIKDESSLAAFCPTLKSASATSPSCVFVFLPPLEEEYPESVAAYHESEALTRQLEQEVSSGQNVIWLTLESSLSSAQKLKTVLRLSDDLPNIVVITAKSYHPYRGAWAQAELSKYLKVAVKGGISRARPFDDELRQRLAPATTSAHDEL